MAFGEWVKQQRDARGLGPAECARRAGMSPQRWSNLEAKSKRPYRETCEAVANGLGMLLEDVMAAAGLTSGGKGGKLGRRLDDVLGPLSKEDRARVEEELVKDAEQYVGLLKPHALEGE